MKKLLVVFCLVGLLAGVGKSASLSFKTGDTTVGIQDLIPATFINIPTGELLVGLTTDLITWKNLLALNGGVITPIQTESVIVGDLNVNIQTACQLLGLSYKLPDPIGIGYFYGKNFNSISIYRGIYIGATIKLNI